MGGGAEPALKRCVVRAADTGPGGKRLEEGPGCFLPTPGGALIGADQRLASRGHHPTPLSLAQRRLEAGQRLGHPLHPCRDHLPIGIGCGGHQIEALTDALERASDDAEITQALAGLVLVDGDLEALAHHLYRHPFRLGQQPNLR